MRTGQEIFLQHLRNVGVFDPIGDRVGTVLDVVLVQRKKGIQALGFVVEVTRKRRVFLPLARVNAFNLRHVVITGLLNMRHFSLRDIEQLAFKDYIGTRVKIRKPMATSADSTHSAQNSKNRDSEDRSPEISTAEKSDQWVTVAAQLIDLSIGLSSNGDWLVTKAFVKEDYSSKRAFRLLKHRKRTLVPVKYVSFSNLKQMSEAGQLIAESVDQKPADLAEQILDFPMKKRFEIAKALNPKQLALVLEEMPEEEQSKILAQFDQEMQADIVQEIQPDDAADLLATLPQQEREDILQKMTPEEAEDVRQLLEYSADSAGGLMTTLPVILSSETDVASALARIRDPDLPPALASVVFVCRPPLETPTGIFQGTAHFQNMLRVPPTTKLGTIIDQALPSLPPDASIDQVMRELATYDTLALPIVSARKQLLGVVSIDDVLDHILPANWREVD